MNNAIGWISFLIATITYLLTIEPTASLWDCGEFISTSYGLEVGHPPGAPLFMIMARFFSIFAPSPDKVALMINAMSALASAFTILFLFWTITHLAKKILVKNGETIELGKTLAIMGAGLTGALAYTFSDTFWFSAVEAEVYASSSLFTAVVFWAILKWEDCADKPRSNRWLILIAYLIGLSIGVHLLNLLAIPAIVFVYYFKKFKPTKLGIIKVLFLSAIILAVIMYGIIPGVIKVATWFELAFVNGLGLPYNTGVIFYAILLIAGISYGIIYTIKKNKIILNTVITCFTVILIGYSSFAMVVIRSLSNPPIDENNPDNAFALLSYLNREQYGDRPLFFGQYYNAPLVDISEGAPVYVQQDGKYKVAQKKQKLTFDDRFTTIFPRMYSDKDYHITDYKYWGGIDKGIPINIDGKVVHKPTFSQNLRFFFRYQLGHMYFRYFMWNFSGRQNDIQGHGEITNGNWITGIPLIDNTLVGNQEKLPSAMKNNKAKNKYYMLPLILGLIGMFWQYKKGINGKQDFWVVMLLFFFTGIAIVIYLNQYPHQPRERDYAYAGSFYAFTIWIGLGVLSIYEILTKKANTKISAIIATTICLILVPGIMAAENWDDHNRSGRYATLSYAKNYLNSCEPNAILFTYGDNDTFPLWYAQEVEGIRRDIRVVNLSLLAGDWYIDQMKRKAYESEGIPNSFEQKQYVQGTRDRIAVVERIKKAYNIKDVINFVKSDDTGSKIQTVSGIHIDYLPTKNLYVEVDSAKVITNGTVKLTDADKILDRLDININRSNLSKSDIMVLDLIAENNWDRPIYFSVGMGKSNYLGFDDYFQLEGAAYRLVPIKTVSNGIDLGRVDTDILYKNMMEKFVWGGIKEPGVHIDHFHSNSLQIMKYRPNFLRLAEQLNIEGQHEKAVKVLDKSLEELPISKLPINNILIGYVQEYYNAEAFEKGNKLLKEIINNSYEHLNYYLSLSPKHSSAFQRMEQQDVAVVRMLMNMAKEYNQEDVLKEVQAQFEKLQ